MVIAAYYSRRKRREYFEEEREKGRKEGRKLADAAWRAWNQRRLAAKDAGQPFDEPPPDFSNGAGDTANP